MVHGRKSPCSATRGRTRTTFPSSTVTVIGPALVQLVKSCAAISSVGAGPACLSSRVVRKQHQAVAIAHFGRELLGRAELHARRLAVFHAGGYRLPGSPGLFPGAGGGGKKERGGAHPPPPP